MKIIERGTQLLDLQYKEAEINARNTLNFLVQKLAYFLKAVGLRNVEIQKDGFPNYANLPENWDKTVPFPNPIHII